MAHQGQIGDLLDKALEGLYEFVSKFALLLFLLICSVLFIPAQTPAVARSEAVPESGRDASVRTNASVLVLLGYKGIRSGNSICDVHDIISRRVAIAASVQG